jgi:purine-binding chemotaxis protein CheW
MDDTNSSGRSGEQPCLCVVVFVCQGLSFAIDVHAVRRIAWLPQLTPVEEMPAYVPGVINVQGSIAPVVDLNARFGHPHQTFRLTDSIILFETRGSLVGLVADEVLDVQNATLVAAPGIDAAGAGGHVRLIAGELDVQGRTVMLLAHDEILPPADLAANAPERTAFFPDATPEQTAVLRERAEALMRESKTETTLLGGLAVIALDGERFGVDLAAVREFSEIGDIVPIPCCPAHIAGNMNLRGDIVTVVDVRGVLKHSAGNLQGAHKLIVSQHEEQLVGVPVEDVLSVIYIDPAQYRKLPAAMESAEQDYLLGEVPFDEKMLTVLDLKRIFEKGGLSVEEEV